MNEKNKLYIIIALIFAFFITLYFMIGILNGDFFNQQPSTYELNKLRIEMD